MKLPGRRARPRLCPHLGLAADPFKHHTGANDEHRCYANLGRERIDLAHQRRFCLASCYERCPFLTVQETGLLERVWAWGRAVSPVSQVRVGVPRRPMRSPWGSPRRAMLAEGLQQARALGGRAWAFMQPQPTPAPVCEPEVVEVATSSAEPVLAADLAEPVAPTAPAEVHSLPEADLVERGISALEAGDEAAAYALFKRATKSQPHDLRAWFWRAKTSEGLDEVITCLEKAHALEPTNTQVKANLDSAIQRREQARSARAAAQATAHQARSEAMAAPWRRRAPRRVASLGGSACELIRTGTAIAAFGVGAAWLLSGLPAELRQAVTSAGGLATLPVPDAARVFAQLPLSLPVLAGYPTASALPYGVGFLAEFVGIGLLSGDRWTRAWAPLVGLGSAWLWLHAAGAITSPLVLAACVLAASGGALVQRGRAAQPAGRQQATVA